MQDLVPGEPLAGQHHSGCSLRAGLAPVWPWPFAGAQWAHGPAGRHILAGPGEGSRTQPRGWCRAVCGCQTAGSGSRLLSRKMQPAHVGLDVEHEMKAEGQNNIFSMPPGIHCVGTLHINRLISEGSFLPVPWGKGGPTWSPVQHPAYTQDNLKPSSF